MSVHGTINQPQETLTTNSTVHSSARASTLT